jgi:L-alanine-DL-glutamate epimerase-like enolase superfamily enzyme
MRVTETAHWLEWQDWADPVLQKPYEIRDGLLHIPDVPGVGSGLAHRRAEGRTGNQIDRLHSLRSEIISVGCLF